MNLKIEMDFLLNFEILRIVIALALTGISAWEDFRTSYISDRWLYAMLGLGGALTLASFDFEFIFWAVLPAILIFGIGYLLYRIGQLGMGDVLLFCGLQLLLPFSSSVINVGKFFGLNSFSPSISFFISILTAASIFALVGSALMYFIVYLRKELTPSKTSIGILLLMIVPVVILMFFVKMNVFTGLFLVLILIPAAFLVAFKQQIYDEVIIKRIPISKIEDEDILAIEKMPKGIVRKYRLGRVLTVKEVGKLKKIRFNENIRYFPVCKILPRFGPYVLGGLLFSLRFGDIFFFFLMA